MITRCALGFCASWISSCDSAFFIAQSRCRWLFAAVSSAEVESDSIRRVIADGSSDAFLLLVRRYAAHPPTAASRPYFHSDELKPV